MMDNTVSSALFNDVLNQLVALGRPQEKLIDYVGLCDFSQEHWQVLQQITTDENELYQSDNDNKFYATLHAGCALFQIDALAATPILLSQFYKADLYDDDWIGLYLKLIISLGAKILPLIYTQISTYLAQGQYSAAGWLVELIEGVAEHENEDIQASIIPFAESFLVNYQCQDDFFNALLVNLLVTCKAVDSIGLIRQAFSANKVELSMLGDIEDTEIYLGLRTQRDTPKPNYVWDALGNNLSAEEKERFFANLEKFANMTEKPMREYPSYEANPLIISQQVIRTEPKIGRNDPCPCGSGKKYKKCCLLN